MREIKVRAWNKAWKCMNLLTGFNLVGKKLIQLYYIDEDGGRSTCTVLLENIELLQFTGLKDKNGVEIYEGDLVEHEDDMDGRWELYEACEIIYSTEVHGFCFRMDEGNSLSDYRNFEVVGNRYENPDLLGGSS